MSQVFPGNELPFYQGVSLKDRASPRACLKNVNMSKRRLFFRHTFPIFLEIHPVFLRQIGFVWRKNFSPLVTFPFFKRRLVFGEFFGQAAAGPDHPIRARFSLYMPQQSENAQYARCMERAEEYLERLCGNGKAARPEWPRRFVLTSAWIPPLG